MLGRRASVAVLVIQALLCISAALTLVALHGDGAWFVFAIGAGEAWTLKWAHLSTRVATYVTVVVPTELAEGTFRLSGPQTAMLYGFIFNLVPLAQFAACVALAWRRYPELLLFPVAQYAFATGLGFGFMSETLIGPGFFWICFFLILRRPLALPLFAVCFAGLMFSHELLVPSALMIAIFAWSQRNGSGTVRGISARSALLVLVCGVVLIAWSVVRLSGGGADGDTNAIVTLDPRRILNDPTLWLVFAAVALLSLSVSALRFKISHRTLPMIVVACGALPVLLHPWLNFAQGRYDSARTLVGMVLLVLGAWAILTYVRRPWRPDPSLGRPLRAATPAILCAALAINVGASVVFLWDWVEAREGFEHVARLKPSAVSPEFVEYQQARSLLSPAEVVANDRMGFPWTWPFRLAVLANNYSPGTVIFNSEDAHGICGSMRQVRPNAGSVPRATIESLASFSCNAPQPPARRRLFRRVLDAIESIFGKRPPS
jgi:hypothetical protein